MAGMVGFIKELVDEIGAADASRDGPHETPARYSKFRSLKLYTSQAFVIKE
jgi:hypothetical protein